MRFGHFFVDRPIFASVISIILIVVGIVALQTLPIAQYPQIAPPTIRVTATYPGASAETIAETVAAPIEQSINGVENMIYMSSQATGDGALSVTVTFAVGTDLDIAQVQVQNRVAAAEPRLPEEVRQLGVNVNKAASDFLLLISLFSPDDSLDELYVSNYALTNIRERLQRIEGVGDIMLFGARELSLRVWLDPARLASYRLTASDIIAALREQNVQVSGGSLGQPPAPASTQFQITVTTLGRFRTPEQFAEVIVKSNDGRLIRLKDVARVEFGARSYSSNSYLDNKYSVGIAVQQRPGSNSLAAAEALQAEMNLLKQDFPVGLDYAIIYNPTQFVAASIEAVTETIYEAVFLVVLVILLFLHNWRAAIIPIASVPVSLIATLFVMGAFGFSINMLTLFGLILAIGIVVDDAIVVVENVERNIAEGKSPREAAHITMDEVGVAVIAIALVLASVFIPTAFIPGLSGTFYQQFALVISSATIFSAINSLSLSPALAAILLKPHEKGERRGLVQRFSDAFNSRFDKISNRYARAVAFVTSRRVLFLAVYAGLIALTVLVLNRVPGGFIPATDQGYGIAVIQLPEGASLQRTDDVVHRATDILLETPGIAHAVGIAGFSGATFSAASNAATAFVILDPFEERLKNGQTADSIIADAQQRLFAIEEGFTIVIKPPPVQGLGSGGGFKMQVQDRGGVGLDALSEAAQALVGAASQDPRLSGVYTTFNTNSPQLFVDVDREKAQILGVPIGGIFEALQAYIGSAYVNDFTAMGRTFQVNLQAEAAFRLQPSDIATIRVRSNSGALVPLGSLVTLRDDTGPYLVTRHNLYNSVAVSGEARRGLSSSQGLLAMEELAAKTLPPGVSFEWTEIAFQERTAGSPVMIFALAVVFVFLLLAAQYESWSLPLAIILIVPLTILAALAGALLRGMDNNILTQVGFIVLIGLAAKNAILIVEFARQEEEQGKGPVEAVIDACRLRLRPILMTSMAFTLGVTPLMIATGPGAELRQAIGTPVVVGMIGVTFLGLFLTPVFYVTIRWIVDHLGWRHLGILRNEVHAASGRLRKPRAGKSK